MLPGKKYSPEDFLRMAWSRKWFIVIPTIIISAGVFVWSYFLPNRYRSETTILVVPQRVPETYVRSTVTADVSERLTTITQQILSRTRLERIIDEFKLYPEERKTMIMEDIVARMRVNDVKIDAGRPSRRRDTSSFTVGFEASNPRTAMLVTERLANMFVQENLEDRELLADSTNQFLQATLEDTRRRLMETEKKVEAFRRENAGRLPTQAQSNLQMLQATQAQLQANQESMHRDRDRLMVLETTMAELVAAPPDLPAAVRSGRPDEPSTATAAQQLETARANLRGLQLRLKPEHPDIVATKRTIAELELKAEAEALAAAVSADSPAATASAQSKAAASRLATLRLEAEELRARQKTRKQEETRLQGLIGSYAARVEAAPGLESAMTELMRDYNTIREQYDQLNKKSEESKLAVNLERRQIGEQFRVIDGARFPERPVSPDRLRLNLLGLLSGLGLGLVLAGFLEYRDTTLKTDDDVIASLQLPVLAVIPAMLTVGERSRIRRRKIVFALSASLASLVLVAAVVVWKMDTIQGWVR
jgi:polysaccharide chain length determinant protein (PEP-CTERM system associated)